MVQNELLKTLSVWIVISERRLSLWLPVLNWCYLYFPCRTFLLALVQCETDRHKYIHDRVKKRNTTLLTLATRNWEFHPAWRWSDGWCPSLFQGGFRPSLDPCKPVRARGGPGVFFHSYFDSYFHSHIFFHSYFHSYSALILANPASKRRDGHFLQLPLFSNFTNFLHSYSLLNTLLHIIPDASAYLVYI